jgi:hypothetical protein
MSARILDFPGAPPQLQLEGYALIAWHYLLGGIVLAYFRPLTKARWPGWYAIGFFNGCQLWHVSRVSRRLAISVWRDPPPEGLSRVVSEAQAFPPKRRRYLAPARILRRRCPAMA